MATTWSIFAAACAIACSGGGGGGGGFGGATGMAGTGGTAQACVPFAAQACTTNDGCPGEQTCTADGLAYTPCECKLPEYVNIEFISAIIGPGKSDGTQWDGTGNVPQEVWDSLAAALGAPGIQPILDFIFSGAVQALAKPDPFGIASLNPFGMGFEPQYDVALATMSNNTEDTFQPTWPQPFPGWPGAYLSPGLAVRVSLTDEDISLHDDIGVATIDYDDLAGAWMAGGTHWVRVAEQTNDQLLAVGVQVTTGVPNQ